MSRARPSGSPRNIDSTHLSASGIKDARVLSRRASGSAARARETSREPQSIEDVRGRVVAERVDQLRGELRTVCLADAAEHALEHRVISREDERLAGVERLEASRA